MTETILRELGAVPEQIDRQRERVRAELFGAPITAETPRSAAIDRLEGQSLSDAAMPIEPAVASSPDRDSKGATEAAL